MIRSAKTIALLGALAALLLLIAAPVQAAGFGFESGSVKTTYETFKEVLGIPQASSHPYAFTVDFKLKLKEGTTETEGGELRDLYAELPPGFAGDPFALPRCTRQEFEGPAPLCSSNTQLGVVHVSIPSLGVVVGPIYNMVPPPGVAAEIGFSAAGLNGLQDFTLIAEDGEDEGRGQRYGLRDHVSFPLEITSLESVFWGTPADPGHDAQRFSNAGRAPEHPTGFIGPEEAFLTLPAECSRPLALTLAVASKLAPTVYSTETAYSLDGGGNPAAPLGCASVPFSPQVASQPTSRSATSPSGLEFQLKLPDEGLTNPDGIAETEPEKVEVVLPEGMTANPSFAEGISTCSEAQYAAEQLETPVGGGCPEASKLGSVEARSPLLEEPIVGSLYLATPYQNRFGSLVAVYMVLRARERGVMIKQAGEVQPDRSTGR
ncbi:MAG TPA: hypothetical protein VMH33_13995, partial [Solirubrobacterales bacterium]|nr:hypothetical protein [Solirubrobacterales bacterium]